MLNVQLNEGKREDDLEESLLFIKIQLQILQNKTMRNIRKCNKLSESIDRNIILTKNLPPISESSDEVRLRSISSFNNYLRSSNSVKSSFSSLASK